MAETNGHDFAEQRTLDTLFGEDTYDAGVFEGIGHVVIREARLADIWPYMNGGAAEPGEFGLRLLAASLEINGRRYSFDEFSQIKFRHLRTLQGLAAKVSEINGLTIPADPPPKKDDAEGEMNPDGSPRATGS